jgi:purine-cytosine permease-like protein
VPLFAVLLADWLLAGRHYTPSAVFRAPELRLEMLAAWLAGFCLYQWLSPQGPGWWTSLVAHAHPHALPWGGASLPSFAGAFALAVLARVVVRAPALPGRVSPRPANRPRQAAPEDPGM